MTGYPWHTGDALLAADLNAAIVAASSGVAAGGPFLQLSGGTMLGPLALAGNAASALQAVPLQQLTAALPPGTVVPAGGSIQAAHDALPATGGLITLTPNTTYTLTSILNITKPNVVIQASAWNTVIQRGAGMTSGHLISATAAGFVLRGVTVDGNNVVGASFEVNVGGADSLVQRCQVIRFNGQAAIGLGGAGCHADGNRIIGQGTTTGGSYGIWAINHVKVLITHNRINGTRLDGIGVDGNGSQVIGNSVVACQNYADTSTIGGGNIVQYGSYTGILIEGNHIAGGGVGDNSYGIEINGPGVSIVGNTISNTNGGGIFVNANSGSGLLISGNTILNAGVRKTFQTAIQIYPPIDRATIVGNRITDNQGTPTAAAGIWFSPGTANNCLICANDAIGPFAYPNNGVSIPTAGTGNIILNNLGGSNTVGLPNYGNDAAAATGNVPIGGSYRNGSIVMVRVA